MPITSHRCDAGDHPGAMPLSKPVVVIEKPMSTPRLLIIHDQPETRARVRHAGERAGLEVVVVERAREAMKRVRETKPRIIVLDAVLDDVDGIALIRQLADDGFDGMLMIVSDHDPRYGDLAEHFARAKGLACLGAFPGEITNDELERRLAAAGMAETPLDPGLAETSGVTP